MAEIGALNVQAGMDFAAMCAGEFATALTVTDGETTVSLTGLFDDAFLGVDNDTQSTVMAPGTRITLVENATEFPLRKRGLVVTVRGKAYVVSHWEYNGEGALTLYMDAQKS